MAINSETATLKLEVDTGGTEASLTKVTQAAEKAAKDSAKAAEDAAERIKTSFEGTLSALGGSFSGWLGIAQQTIGLVQQRFEEFAAYVERGDRVGDVYAALTINVDKASESVSGLIGKFELAQAANRAMEAGLDLDADSFAALTVRAQQYADATGVDGVQALDKLVMAIIRGVDRFKAFGIEAEGSKAMLEEVTREVGETTVGIQGMSDALAASKNKWQELKDAIAIEVDEQAGSAFGPLFLLLTKVTGGAAGLAGGIVHLGRAITSFATGPMATALNAAHEFASILASNPALQRLMNGASNAEMAAGWNQHVAGLALGYEMTRGMPYTQVDDAGMSIPPESLASPAPTERELTAARNRARAQEQEAREARARNRSGSSNQEDPLYQRAQREQEVREQIAALDQQETEMRAGETQRRLTLVRTEIDETLAQNDRQNQAWERSHRAEEQRHRTRVQRWRAEARIDRQLSEEGRQRRMQEAAIWAQLTSAILQTTIASIVEGQTAWQVARSVAAAVLNGVSQIATTKAIEQMALALGSYPNVPAMASHAGSAALWAGLAVGAGVAGGYVQSGVQDELAASKKRSAEKGVGDTGAIGAGSAGRSGGGESVVNVTVMLDAAGGVVHDAQLRRLGKYVSEAGRRGYVGYGRQAA